MQTEIRTTTGEMTEAGWLTGGEHWLEGDEQLIVLVNTDLGVELWIKDPVPSKDPRILPVSRSGDQPIRADAPTPPGSGDENLIRVELWDEEVLRMRAPDGTAHGWEYFARTFGDLHVFEVTVCIEGGGPDAEEPGLEALKAYIRDTFERIQGMELCWVERSPFY